MTDRIPPEVLERAGRALFGDRWKTPVAEILGTTEDRVHKLLSGRTVIRAPYGQRLLEALDNARLENLRAARDLQAAINAIED
jgi:plasmid maintenance system antidote protein VapI